MSDPDTNRVVLLAERPDGVPDSDTFEFVDRQVPDPGHDEVLVRTLYLSVDPYMRGRMRDSESYAEPWAVGDPLRGRVVGAVVESNHDDFAVGDVVTGNLYWADYAAADGDDLRRIDPDVAPLSAHLGVLGMPGQTAYFGMLRVADVEAGDTVVVSAASGAVGSVAGQLARIAGCRVVGITGSGEKGSYLTDELGFDAAIDYSETEDYRAALDEVAPEGVDVYFDNVGGPITDAVFTRLNEGARVAVCGQISLYNEEVVPTGPRKLGTLIRTRARVEGFLVSDFAADFGRATERLGSWVRGGDIRYRETVTEGLENAPDAFLALFEGDKFGKQLVRVGDPAPYESGSESAAGGE
jgi:NADPH-dependent curcumin reductase CurA